MNYGVEIDNVAIVDRKPTSSIYQFPSDSESDAPL